MIPGKSLQFAEKYEKEEEVSGNSLTTGNFPDDEAVDFDYTMSSTRKVVKVDTSSMPVQQCGIHKKVREERRRGNQPWALKIIGTILIYLYKI